jgi:hypothetical protein
MTDGMGEGLGCPCGKCRYRIRPFTNEPCKSCADSPNGWPNFLSGA